MGHTPQALVGYLALSFWQHRWAYDPRACGFTSPELHRVAACRGMFRLRQPLRFDT